MNIDFIRGITAHITAAFAVIVGMLSLIWLTANGTVDPTVGVPAIVAIIAGATGFLFGAETAKQAAKQAKADLLTNTDSSGAP